MFQGKRTSKQPCVHHQVETGSLTSGTAAQPIQELMPPHRMTKVYRLPLSCISGAPMATLRLRWNHKHRLSLPYRDCITADVGAVAASEVEQEVHYAHDH